MGVPTQTVRSVAQGSNGCVACVDRVEPGSVILYDPAVIGYEIKDNKIVIGEICVCHSCDSNTYYIEGRLVASKKVEKDDVITVDLRLVKFKIPAFDCKCGAKCCQGTVTGFSGLSLEEQDANLHLAEPPVRVEVVEAGTRVYSSCPVMEIRANGGMGQAAFATKAIEAGTTVFEMKGFRIDFPTMYTIAILDGKHLLFADGAHCLAHSCNPNVRIVVHESTFEMVTTKPIAEGEIMAFNYLTTEWVMNSPFDCLCGADYCYKRIAGFVNLNAEQSERLIGDCSEVVKTAYAKKLESG